MNKLCCCSDSELPDISVNVTCACCESHVEEKEGKDSPDLNVVEATLEEVEEDKVCCCFHRKRHAKAKKKKPKRSS